MSLVCPNGHDPGQPADNGGVPACRDCGAELVDSSAVIEVHKQTRQVWLAYDVGVLPVDRSLPDIQVNPADGEGVLSTIVLTAPDRTERLVILVGDDQARRIVKGLVEAHGTAGAFGVPDIVIPDSIPPGLTG